MTEEELLRKIEIEEEVENTIEKHIREKQALSEKNKELQTELSEKDQLIEALRRQLDTKNKS